jgi:Ca2+:H+ antiporter
VVSSTMSRSTTALPPVWMRVCCSPLRRTAKSLPARSTPRRAKSAWPIGVALVTLAVVTVLVVALVSEIFVEFVQKAPETLGMSQAFVGFIVVALVGGAAEMAVAFSAARKDRLDLSVGIALGSASQIALFVGPVLVLLSYVIGPTPMDLQFWPGAAVMVFVATLVAAFITSGGRSASFVGVLLLLVYAVFAITLTCGHRQCNDLILTAVLSAHRKAFDRFP